MLPVGLTHELSGMCMLLVCALRVSLYLVPEGIGASSVACAVVLSSCPGTLVPLYRCAGVGYWIERRVRCRFMIQDFDWGDRILIGPFSAEYVQKIVKMPSFSSETLTTHSKIPTTKEHTAGLPGERPISACRHP